MSLEMISTLKHALPVKGTITFSFRITTIAPFVLGFSETWSAHNEPVSAASGLKTKVCEL